MSTYYIINIYTVVIISISDGGVHSCKFKFDIQVDIELVSLSKISLFPFLYPFKHCLSGIVSKTTSIRALNPLKFPSYYQIILGNELNRIGP